MASSPLVTRLRPVQLLIAVGRIPFPFLLGGLICWHVSVLSIVALTLSLVQTASAVCPSFLLLRWLVVKGGASCAGLWGLPQDRGGLHVTFFNPSASFWPKDFCLPTQVVLKRI